MTSWKRRSAEARKPLPFLQRRGFLAALLIGPCLPAKPPEGVDYTPPGGWFVRNARCESGRWVVEYQKTKAYWHTASSPWEGLEAVEYRFIGPDRIDVVWA